MSPRAPIALVGAACRLPGGCSTLDRFAEHVLRGEDAVGPPPAWRGFEAVYHPTPGTLGKTCQIGGGYLEDLRDFDAAAFGLSAREATSLDPQQRLLLEVTRDALEHAGATSASLAAARTGVFVGISGSEFKVLAQRRGPAAIDAFIGTGTQTGVAAGRLAYVLGTSGRAVSIDTACSSGLVALHDACRALWDGEVDAAIVAGVSVLLDPDAFVSMSTLGTLSPSGRCHSFSARADGYVRSEGCVALLLRRAPEPSDRVLGWIEGTAAGHDGRSNGLTAPRAGAQQDVMRAALADAGLGPDDLGYVEGHGSATPLGDAVELSALEAVHAGRPDRLVVGSIKASMGHLEAASGLAGLLRALVAARTGRAPPQLHADPPCDALRSSRCLAVHPGGAPLSRPHVGVSSFGIGGTNVHVVLRAAEPVAPTGAALATSGPRPVVLSARSEGALVAHVRAVTGRLPDLPFDDACGTLARGREAGPWRVAVVGEGAREAVEALAEARARHVAEPPRVALLFPGQGTGLGSGAALAAASPVARQILERVAAVADPLLAVPLSEALRAPRVDDVRVLQVGVFAVSMALAEVLRGLGLRPIAVAGHSSGEVPAACIAGALTHEDAVRLLVARGEALHRSGPGGMAAAVAPPEVLGLGAGPVGIAAVNHPGETVLSGPTPALEAVVAGLRERGIVVRSVDFARAGHSALVEPHLSLVEQAAAAATWRAPTLDLVSTLTGAPVAGDLAEPAYWSRQLRNPVRFADALTALDALGVDAYVELGPHPVLTAAVGAVLPGRTALRALHREEDVARSLASLVAEVWSRGAPVDPGGLWPTHRTVDLPLTPREPKRLWPSDLGGARRPALHEVRFEPVPLPERGPGGGALRLVGGDPALREVLRVAGVTVVDAGGDGLVACAPEALDPRAATTWAADLLREAAERAPAPRVWLVLPEEPLAAAAITGLARCAMLETPELRLTILPPAPPETLWRLLALPAERTVGRLGDGRYGVARWRDLPDRAVPPFATSGTWIVTGGLGALGRHTTRWLLERGATRVIAVGRSAAEGGGIRADVSRAEDVRRVLSLAGDDLVGVVHAAVVVRDQWVHALTPDTVAEVFAPEVEGALHLERELASRPEVLLLLHGSVARWLGGRGQGAYAAAKAVTARVAARRRAAGGRAVVVDWGPWAGGGLGEALLEHRVTLGMPLMAPEAALSGLDVALADEGAELAIVDLDLERLPRHPLLHGGDVRERPLAVEGALLEHVLDGRVVLSGADRVVLALELSGARALARARYPAVIALQPGTRADVRATVRDGELALAVDGVTALTAALAEPESAQGEIARARAACTERVDLDALFARFERDGLILGRGRRLVTSGFVGPEGWLVELAPGGEDGARLDACLLLGGEASSAGPAAIPSGFDRLSLEAPLSTVQFAHGVRRSATPEAIVSDVTLFDAAGRPVGAIRGHTLVRRAVRRGLRSDAPLSEVVAWVTTEAASLLGKDATTIGPDRELADLGFDSIMGVELRNRVTAEGLSVPLHLVVGAATPLQIARGIVGDRAEAPAVVSDPVALVAPSPTADTPRAAGELGSYASAAFVGAVGGAGLYALLDWLLAG